MESMDQAPYLLPKARTGYRMGDGKLVDSMIHDGLWDAFSTSTWATSPTTSTTSSRSARGAGRMGGPSHQRAEAATRAAVRGGDRPDRVAAAQGRPDLFDTDEGVRPGTTAESLAKLKPVFQKDGTITAGNASRSPTAARRSS